MTIQNRTLQSLAILFLLSLSGCGLLKRSSTPAEPIIDYRPLPGNLQPDIYLYRISKNQSKLFLRIPRNFLIAGKMEGDSVATVSLLVDAKIYGNPDNPVANDSISISIKPSSTELSKSFIYNILEIPAIDSLHWVKLTLTDEIRGIGQLYYLKMPADENCAKCLVKNAQTKQPIYRNSLKINEKFELSCTDFTPDSIKVEYRSFNSSEGIAGRPDSSWFEKPVNGLFGAWEKEGLYLISYKNDEPKIEVKIFNKNYPSLNTPDQLVEPLKYIAKRNEITTLDTTTLRKITIDNFWLSRAKDANHARNLLTTYYGRVFWSNQIFTEQIPGWQTDRGRTLILLGIPEEAISNGQTERWYYRNENEKRFSVEFTDQNIDSQTVNFRISKKIPTDIEKLAIDGWNKGEPINFGQINLNR